MNNYEDIKTEILNKAKVYDIVSSYGIDVTKKGDNYWCICPFHEDHNPSMSMPSDGKIYTCFVCHAHGNVFNFIMDYENVSFVESIKIASSKLGLSYNFKSSNTPKKNNNFKSLYDIYDYSKKYYVNKLKSKDGVTALEYLYNRGFTDDVINEFGVGLSTNNGLNKVLKEKFSTDDIIKSNICNYTDSGLYDMFTNRIMFPLSDLDGNVVGFSGRIYKDKDKSESKYVNSKASDIFIKGNILYNYKKAKESSRIKNQIIVVEGFMDVIALYKIGINNVVAGMGTAITSAQANLIKRMGKDVILMFDGDEAGDKATKACILELKNINVIPKIVRLPNNMDPDEYINEFGKEKLINLLDKPLTLLDYMLASYKKDVDFRNSESVSNYIKNVCKEISNIEDKLVLELEIEKLSKETGVSTSSIKKLIDKKEVKVIRKEEKEHKLNKYDKAEISLLYYMIKNNNIIKLFRNNKCIIPTKEYRYLASEIVHYFNEHNSFDSASFLAYLGDDELVSTFNKIDTLDFPLNITYEEVLEFINLLNNKCKEDEIKFLKDKFKKTFDEDEKLKIVEEICKLRSECNE